MNIHYSKLVPKLGFDTIMLTNTPQPKNDIQDILKKYHSSNNNKIDAKLSKQYTEYYQIKHANL